MVTNLYTYLQVPTGTFRHLQVPAGTFRYLQVPTGAYRYLQVPTTRMHRHTSRQHTPRYIYAETKKTKAYAGMEGLLASLRVHKDVDQSEPHDRSLEIRLWGRAL